MSDDSEVNTAADNENEIDAEEEVKDATPEENDNAAEPEGEAENDVEKTTKPGVAAGVGTKSEETISSQRRHYPDIEANEGISKDEAVADFEKTIQLAAGERMKTEESIPTQRRHFPASCFIKPHQNAESEADEKSSEVNVEITTKFAAGERMNTDESVPSQRRHFPASCFINPNQNAESEADEESSEDAAESDVEKTTQLAAGERMKTEESIPTQRRHFPGKTTSHIFG